ncbi:MAG: 6-pyruvoyl tetrahydropterin synthase family protein [Planctomycetota bacterium]
MASPIHRVVLEKDELTFSAAHFITFDQLGEVICEPIHGHNYGVRCEVEGTLNEHGYVVDFVLLTKLLKEIVEKLDHHVMLPEKHPVIKVEQTGSEVVTTYEQRRWVFPKQDCAILPISNTTAELIAGYVAEYLITHSTSWMHDGIQRLVVGIDENQGQWGECQIDF